MKTEYLQSLSLAALTVAATLLLAGCASSGYEKGNKTAANIQAAANLIAALPGQIDTTLTSLQDIVQKPQADLRPQYKQFAANVVDVESSAKDIASARRSMGENQKEFLAKWDEQLAQIKNEDIKARSQTRKDEVNQKLLSVKKSYTLAETDFKPFMSDLRDVQKFLSVDLTTGGVAAIKDTAAKATQHAVPLKASLAKLAEDFKALGVSMSSVTAPPAK
jgi:outer membrane murein-binding lipoprotein Lpp